jgi:putative tryptophan/tyrosine transport system ATP-binding protein
MIQLAGIEKYFNRNTPTEVHALKGVDLILDHGEFTVVIGGNGSGKSTLLNVISGAVNINSGLIKVEGREISALPEYKRSQYISRVFQNPFAGTVSELSVLENFRLASLRGKNKGFIIGTRRSFEISVKEKVAKLGLGLENKIQNKMGTLSGGQRQALTLLMATLDESRVLLMDEPTAALDPKTASRVMEMANELIRKLHQTCLMVTHNLKDALRYGDRLIMMSDGKIIHDIRKEEKLKLQAETIYDWF